MSPKARDSRDDAGRGKSGLERFRPGTLLASEFQLTDVLAEGGMGVIYRAIQRTTGAERAIKVMHPSLLRSDRSRARFLQEARVSSSLRSDHVAKVIAAGIDQETGMPWLAMELLEGMDLAAKLRQSEHLTLAEVAGITSQIGHALGAAHDCQVIHCDLKPENIFLASSQLVGMPFVVKLLDFGIAKLVAESEGTTTGIGTPAYMAPEQTSSSTAVSPATDIWALGLVVFRALVGRCYWHAANELRQELAVLWREILIDPMPSASARAAEYGLESRVPRDFDDWFRRCVAREPEARYQDVRRAAADLGELVASPRKSPTAPALAALVPASSRPTMDRMATMPLSRNPTEPASAPHAQTARAQVKVTYQSPSERIIVRAEPGMSLLEVSRDNDIPHIGVCGGRARCTTCRVLVMDNGANLSPRTGPESAVAKRKRWPRNIRLACQARVTGPVTVRQLVRDRPSGLADPLKATEPVAVESTLSCVLAMKAVGLSDFTDSSLVYDVAHVVHRLLEAAIPPIEQNSGQIDRCSGSEILASFSGLPDVAAAAALRAALRMKARVEVLDQYLTKHFDLSLRLRIGLHHGDVIVGNLGHPFLRERQIFGSGVEDALAARQAAARHQVAIVATDAYCAAVGDIVTIGQTIEADAGARTGDFVEIVDFETPDTVFLVQSTFERVLTRADEFTNLFYDRLFAQYPEVAPLFADVDMDNQRHMLMNTIESVVTVMHDPDKLREPLRELGRRHVAYGTKLIHYKFVGESLLWALARFFGDDFVPELRIAWRDTYGMVARLMIEGAVDES